MKITTFASIYIGSYEMSMKIYELSATQGVRQIDLIRYRIELGKEAYNSGDIGYELVEEMCQILIDFEKTMNAYKVHGYRACASSALRETKNVLFILNQLKLRTNIDIEVLSNSEQRFITYKAIAMRKNEFEPMSQKGTAIADIGGGSVQITIFAKDNVMTTQNIRIGTMRIREKLASIQNQTTHFEKLIQELIDKELTIFKEFFLQEIEIQQLIVMGDYVPDFIKKSAVDERGYVEKDNFFAFYNRLEKESLETMMQTLDLPFEYASLVVPSLVLCKRLMEVLNATYIWTPGITTSDGMAYDYAEQNRIIKESYDFNRDILSASKNIAKRYHSYSPHIVILRQLAVQIFDAMKKIHGLEKRHRLLLESAIVLHDCGKYISLSNGGECSYQIIMSTEIMGITHIEREMIASAAKYNSIPLPPYAELANKLDKEEYLTVAKFVAILRVVNALDRSHRQKFKNVKVNLKEKQLVIQVDSIENILLEKGLFEEKADFFEQVFSIRPMIKWKKDYSGL